MRKNPLIVFITILLIYSCNPRNTSEKPHETVHALQDSTTISLTKFIDTQHEYTDAAGNILRIENSLPKGGLKYTDTNGNEYVYAIFWTQITNKTDQPFELHLHFPTDTFALASSPGNYVKLFLPSAEMTAINAPLFNYGLGDLEVAFGHKLQQPSTLQRTIKPNEVFLFYVATLFKEGVDGVVRAGFRLSDDKVYFRINDLEMQSGYFKANNLYPGE